MKKNNHSVIYESPSKLDAFFIYWYLKRKIPVWIIEPFHAYHHKKGIRFFPPHLPDYVSELIHQEKLLVIKAEEIDSREIYALAADKGVSVVESAYPEYRKEHAELIDYVRDTLKSDIAEDVFKMSLCNSIAEFYSVNILLQRISEIIRGDRIVFCPDNNVRRYLNIKKLLKKSRQSYFDHPNIFFSLTAHAAGFFENMKNSLIATGMLCAQTIASGILGKTVSDSGDKNKFTYGVAVLGQRQLRGTKRGPDFIIDNSKILSNDVVYFPLFDLSDEQKELLKKIPGSVHYPPKIGKFFSNFREWKNLLLNAAKKDIFRNAGEVNAASSALFNYFRWKYTLKSVNIRHFITHADFGTSHVGRNLALTQAGVQTWYFTDSMNHTNNFVGVENTCLMRHPFWTYLYYNHFVTWNEDMVQYYSQHPGVLKQNHVVGCLWGDHIQNKKNMWNLISIIPAIDLQGKFVVAVFDSTYSINGITSYQEGVQFAEHIYRLAEECPDIYVLLKEKKSRTSHKILDPINGPKLTELYAKMDRHKSIMSFENRTEVVDKGRIINKRSGVTNILSQADAANLISVSDLTVSFPFTSTTFEALSAKRPAIWHDPMGYYKNTSYGKAGGVVTHSYDELKAKVLAIKSADKKEYRNPLPTEFQLMDPYCDGKAIDRFRELLISSQ